MSRVVAVVRRLLADPHPGATGPRPMTVRLFDGVIWPATTRRWV